MADLKAKLGLKKGKKATLRQIPDQRKK